MTLADTTETRWPETLTIDGIDFHIEDGTKFPGDLVLSARGSDGVWRKVRMELAFFLIDFIADNEERRSDHMSYWKWSGKRYFMDACWQAAKGGYRNAADKVKRQRDNLA